MAESRITPQALLAKLPSDAGNLLTIDAQGNATFLLASSTNSLLKNLSILLQGLANLTIQLNSASLNTSSTSTIDFVNQSFNTSQGLQNVYTVTFNIDGTTLDSKIVDPTA